MLGLVVVFVVVAVVVDVVDVLVQAKKWLTLLLRKDKKSFWLLE